MTLSIVTTLYRSARHLDEFHRRAVAAAAGVAADWELVLVNDGSPDDSLDVALALRRRDPRVRVIDLSRNFGHHAAMMEGLRQSHGDLVFLLDSDLEEAPEWLGEFHTRLAETGADAVYGVQRTRKGGWVERATGWIFYNVLAGPLGLPWQANVVTARLMTRRFVDALAGFQEREMTLVGLCALTGFAQQPISVEKISRGGSTYRPRLRLAMFVNAVTSFSNRPLVLVFELGCVIMAASIVAALYMVWRRATGHVGVPGYASLVVSIWFLGGLMIFCIGLVGIYLSKVFIEVKQRPRAIVRARDLPRD
jgi:putative glycosyltransferase